MLINHAGYYVPDLQVKEETPKKESTDSDEDMEPEPVDEQPKTKIRREYLSPILLIENCGQPIDPDILSVDERQECASILYRMHRAGWTHGSFYARNIVYQPGPLTQWPTFRGLEPIRPRVFRLIDFGRSAEITGRDSMQLRGEEAEVLKLFDIEQFPAVNYFRTEVILLCFFAF